MTQLPNWFNAVKSNFETFLPKDTPFRVLQIGVYTGDATKWMLDNLDIVSIDDVDTWAGSSSEEEHQALDFSEVEQAYDAAIKDPRVIKHKMTSDVFFQKNTKTFNFIYIDGDHTATQTAIDGLNALRVLEPGGVIAFDDYLWKHPNGSLFEPKLGIEAALHVNKDQLEKVEYNYQMWAWKKL